ncbi:hypothetical protein D4R99_05430, partial [bacterium]
MRRQKILRIASVVLLSLIAFAAVVMVFQYSTTVGTWFAFKKYISESKKINTDNWNTYTDNKLGYTFKYPKDWTVEKDSYENTRLEPPTSMLNKENNELGTGAFLDILIKNDSKDLVANNKYLGSFFVIDGIKTKTDMWDATNRWSCSDCGNEILIRTLVVKDNKNFSVRIGKNDKYTPNSLMPIFVAVLQSFHFAKDSAVSVMDYSFLEKNRFYTEEEGSYTKINEAEKKLLRSLLVDPSLKCDTDPNGIYCDEEKSSLENSRILSVKKNFLLLEESGFLSPSYYIYDLKTGKITGESFRYTANDPIKNDNFAIFVKENEEDQTLIYYKPGMSSFVPIPLSKIKI